MVGRAARALMLSGTAFLSLGGRAAAQSTEPVDFFVTNVRVQPGTAAFEDTLTVTARAEQSGGHIGNVSYAIFLSENTRWERTDQAVFQGSVFFAGEPATEISTSFPLRALAQDPEFAPGSYEVIVRIDSADALSEPDEDNNAQGTGSTSALTLRSADLRITELDAAGSHFLTTSMRVRLTIENNEDVGARGFRYRYYLSQNDIVRTSDLPLMTSALLTLAPREMRSFTDLVPVTALSEPGSWWFGVIVDVLSAVPETNEENNVRVFRGGDGTDPGGNAGAIRFLPPRPELSVEEVNPGASAAAGEPLAVSRVLINDGPVPAQFDYGYVLSSNENISQDDLHLATFTATLAPGRDGFAIDRFDLPSTIAEGTYYIGVRVDPEDTLEEFDRANNDAASAPIPLFRTGLRFVNETLPAGITRVPYSAGVFVEGGAQPVTWSLVSGGLPDGLALNPTDGVIDGTPARAALFEFALQAYSGSATAVRPFSIRITDPTVPLEVATAELGAALAGRPNQGRLVAVGGTAPYLWEAQSGFPVGLDLAPDGMLDGTPAAAGTYAMIARVRDALGAEAQGRVSLTLVGVGRSVQIEPTVLPTGRVAEDYCALGPVRFQARDGTPPYRWEFVGAPVPGMSLEANGVFCGTPEQVGDFPFQLRVQDASGLFDLATAVLTVSGEGALAILTVALDDADLGVPYRGVDGTSVTLQASQGTEPYIWTVLPGSGALAPGLVLEPSGEIAGVPESAGLFAFIVRARDAVGRIDDQALSVFVRAPQAEPPPNEGCRCVSSEGRMPFDVFGLAGLGMLVGLLCLGFATGRRGSPRRHALRGRATWLGLCLAAPLPAQAQTVPGTPYLRAEAPIAYRSCPDPVLLATNADELTVDLDLPFPFRFYDAVETAVTISVNGFLGVPAQPLTSDTQENEAPGVAGSVQGFVAPFWDDLELFENNAGYLAHSTSGTAPARQFCIEWHNLSRSRDEDVLLNFKVILHEGEAGRMDIEYGPSAGTANFSATMAAEDRDDTRPIFLAPSACVTECRQDDLAGLDGYRVTLVQDAGVELRARAITAPSLAFVGVPASIPIAVESLHGQPIGPATVEIRVADNPDMAGARALGRSDLTVLPFERVETALRFPIPSDLPETPHWAELVVDPDDELAEAFETNNRIVSSTPVRVFAGAADLAVQTATASAVELTAGGELTIAATIENRGTEAALAPRAQFLLSSNPVLTGRDLQLAERTVVMRLEPGETATTSATVEIGPLTNPGAYFVGVRVDSAETSVELDEANNARPAPEPVVVFGGPLVALTEELPLGFVDRVYVARLNAVGGNLDRTWTLREGLLPEGIELAAESGELFGRPVRAESVCFTVEVTSGAQLDSADLCLRVSDPREPLTIVDRNLPFAVVGQEYAFTLRTAGADEALATWSAESLPPGLALGPSGLIAGTPSLAGTFPFVASVEAGTETASAALELRVTDNPNLLIAPNLLPPAQFGAPYDPVQFAATGGLGELVWRTDPAALPTGMRLSRGGLLFGTPMRVGAFLFEVEVLDGGPLGAEARDRATFRLVVADGDDFVISTPELPAGFVNEGYDARISADGGLPPLTWTIEEGRLPAGLMSSINPTTNDLQIVGEPETEGTVNLRIAVRDAQNRRTQKGFAVRILAERPSSEEPSDPSGCRCVRPGRPLPWALLIVGLFGRWRARRRPPAVYPGSTVRTVTKGRIFSRVRSPMPRTRTTSSRR